MELKKTGVGSTPIHDQYLKGNIDRGETVACSVIDWAAHFLILPSSALAVPAKVRNLNSDSRFQRAIKSRSYFEFWKCLSASSFLIIPINEWPKPSSGFILSNNSQNLDISVSMLRSPFGW